MKRAYLLSAATALVALTMTACGGSTEAEETAGPVTYALDASASSLKWKGDYADGSHSHNGTVKITEGTIVYNGDAFESGSLKVDMKTVDSELDGTSGESDLLAHLGTPDFLNSSAFPTTEVKINSMTDKEATATVTVGGKAIETTIPVDVKKTDDKLTVKGKFDLDLTSLGAKGFQRDVEMEKKMGKENQYVSPLIHFELDLVMKAEAAK